MVIALVIVSILLALIIFIDVIIAIAASAYWRREAEEAKLEEEFLFFNGDIEIPEEDIEKAYYNVLTVCKVEVKDDLPDDVIEKIIDVSQYEKNHIIGLTFFVQKQECEKLKAQLDESAEEEENFINQLIHCEDINPFIPDCTFYKMKDGRWLFRLF